MSCHNLTSTLQLSHTDLAALGTDHSRSPGNSQIPGSEVLTYKGVYIHTLFVVSSV